MPGPRRSERNRLRGLVRERGSKAVAQILSFCGITRVQQRCAWFLSIALGVALLLCIPLVSAQPASVATRKPRPAQHPKDFECNSWNAGITITDKNGLAYTCESGDNGSEAPKEASKKDKEAPAASLPPVPVQANPDPTPVAPAPAQNPVAPPVITWDGKKLTIDAENSTLSAILLGVRSSTGASIDMPASTSKERVAVHLGPAPIREVLSSLLYGTDFDYIIQGSDTDENGLRSVTLTARDQSDDVVATSDAPGSGKRRLAPGYVAPGKHDFEVVPEASDAAAPPAETAAGSDAVTPNPGPGSAGTDSAATAQASGNPDSQPPSPPAESAAAGMSTGAPLLSNTTPVGSLTPSTSSDAPSITQMEQNMQQMYEQRRQLQAQQKMGTQPPGK
jgi:hypothetical protein